MVKTPVIFSFEEWIYELSSVILSDASGGRDPIGLQRRMNDMLPSLHQLLFLIPHI
jgi:hypothetical protein